MSKNRLAAKAIVFVGLLGFACAPSETGSTSTLEYTVLDESLDESPGKTQVSIDVLVPESATEAKLTALLERLHDEASDRSGFRYHDHPTVVAIYAYPSREHAESGMGQWIGMLTRTPGNPEPRIDVRALSPGSEPETRFGLSEQERKDIYKRIVSAEDRGQREAEREFPADLEKQFARADELAAEYKADLAGELGITLEDLAEIAREGLEKNWPFPQM